jgi:aldehyde:ferredoxin oxidoreductase
MGFGTRKEDAIPYRAMGPVTEEEYQSRTELYDKILQEDVKYNISGKTVQQKIKALRKYREKQYQLLCDAVYKRRGWDNNGVPTLETIKKLNIDFPTVITVWHNYQKSQTEK